MKTHASSRPVIAILADFPWDYLDVGVTGRGGGQACTWLAQIAEAFATQTVFDLHWIAVDRDLPFWKCESRTALGQVFHRVGGLKVSVDLFTGYLTSTYLIKRLLDHLVPSVVHCWGTERCYPSSLGYPGAVSILSMQGVLTAIAKVGGLPDTAYWNRLVELEPSYVRRADVVVAESSWGVEQLKKIRSDGDFRVIEYGVHNVFFREVWNPDENHPILLYAGGLHWRKGVDVLFDAIELVKERHWELRIAGDGELVKELKSRNLPRVTWLGNLQWDELIAEMKRAWCLVVPTRVDSGPSVVKEARVVGLPVIGSVHGGLRDYLQDSVNGFLVDPLRPDVLAAKIADAMSDFDRLRAIGLNCLEVDRLRFDPSVTAKRFLDLYAETLHK